MKYKTRNQRLQALFSAYINRSEKKAATTREVAEWGLKLGLLPAPTCRDSKELCEEWERKFEAAVK